MGYLSGLLLQGRAVCQRSNSVRGFSNACPLASGDGFAARYYAEFSLSGYENHWPANAGAERTEDNVVVFQASVELVLYGAVFCSYLCYRRHLLPLHRGRAVSGDTDGFHDGFVL